MRGQFLVVAAALLGCAPTWKDLPHATPYQEAQEPKLHSKPKSGFSVSDWWDFGLHTAVVPLAKTLSPARWVAAVSGNKPSLDTNEFGKVPDSQWFHNRITRSEFSIADLIRGPNRLGRPADGPLTVLSGKTEGNTPGLVLKDSKGAVWFVKFDPPAFRELSTSAELVASKFLHAAGYWVPETYILELDVRRLQLDEAAWTRDSYNRRIPLKDKELTELIALMNPDPRGKLRSLFSRAVPGQALGPFSYRGVRANDPNDRIPHERRRSLRGLWILVAWLNNTDVRRQNTLDTFIPVSGERGFVRHYLIDFGDSLGAAGDREKYKGEGYEVRIDFSEMGLRGLALGLYYPYWLKLRRSPYRSVGIFESKVFDPARWVPVVENAAFEEAEPEDTFWGASLLARFTPKRIKAVVAEAGYREEGAAEYVAKVLIERRRKLLRYAFKHMLGLDDARVEGRYRVVIDDLEKMGGLIKGAPRYHFKVIWNRTRRLDRDLGGGVITGDPDFDLRDFVTKVMTEDRAGFEADPFLTLVVQRRSKGPSVEIHLRAVKDFLLPVALRRVPVTSPPRFPGQ